MQFYKLKFVKLNGVLSKRISREIFHSKMLEAKQHTGNFKVNLIRPMITLVELN